MHIHPQNCRPLFRRDEQHSPRTSHEAPAESFQLGDGVLVEVFKGTGAVALSRARDASNVDFPLRHSRQEWAVELSRDANDRVALLRLISALADIVGSDQPVDHAVPIVRERAK